MNETSFDPGTAPGPAPQAPQQPHQDLARLRRSTSDRYVAGVAGGLGRHLGVDPTIIRVLLAVLTFFGGAGVLIYGVCWAFVPEDGSERAPINVGVDLRKIILLATAALAVLLAVGDAFSGFNAGWPIASIAVIVAIVLIARDRRSDRRSERADGQPPLTHDLYAQPTAGTTWASTTDAPAAATTGTAEAPAYAATGPTPGYAPPPPPAWQPPVGQPPLVPPHRKRTGIIWFWPTLALIAIALGTLGIVDADHHVNDAAYPALALAITGVMLLVGAFVGRPGGLVLLGIVSTMSLSTATILGGFHFDGREIQVAPTTAAAVQSSYTAHNGRIELDLTKVTDPQNLAGREIELSLKAGEIVVIVPRSLNVEIEAEFDFAGGIDVPGYSGGGIQDDVERRLEGVPATSSEPLDLDISATVGHIEVEQR